MSELLDTAETDYNAAEPQASRPAAPLIRPTDAERLMRFWRRHDQAALEELIERHAPMVWGVCSQVLRRREDAEDAFQATFLILARKARSIRAADSIAGWLYRVAFRTALLAHSRRNRLAETSLAYEPATDDDQLEAIARNEQCRVLLEELHALPLQYREPLVLCYLEGRSRSEAADELGVTPQSVKGRLARGTRLLRSRMVSRGAALSTTMTVVTASISSAQAAAPPALVSTTAALGASFAMKLTGAGAQTTAQTTAAVLAEKGILSMTLIAAAKPAVAVLGACLAAGMFAVATADGPGGNGVGTPLLFLADSEAGADVREAEGDEIEIDVAASGDGADERRIEVEARAVEAADDAQPKPQPVAAVGAWTLLPSTAAQAAPAAPPVPAAAPMTPADKFRTWIGGGEGPVIAPLPGGAGGAGSFHFRLPEGADPSALSYGRLPTSSEATLKLEQEYWDIKASALKKKAEALMAKVDSLEETGAGSRTEVLDARADAELTLAEVKLCEVNALKVKEQLEAAEAGKLKQGSKGVHVRVLQELLNARVEPSPKLVADGDFGPLTEQAVKKFQNANGLSDTGVVDEKTAIALGFATHPGADVLQPSFARVDVLKEAPIELHRRIEVRNERHEPRMILKGADEKPISKWSESPQARVEKERAAAAAEEAAAKHAAIAKQRGQSAERKAHANALREELDAMRAALKELQAQVEEEEETVEERGQ